MLKSSLTYGSGLLLLIATTVAAAPAKVAFMDLGDRGTDPFRPGCNHEYPKSDTCEGTYTGPVGDRCLNEDLLEEERNTYITGYDADNDCVKGSEGGPSPVIFSCFAQCLAIGYRLGGWCQVDHGGCLPGVPDLRIDSAHCVCDTSY